MMPMKSGSPPVALVTGASRGLGAVLVEFLLEEGFVVIGNSRDPKGLKDLADRLPSAVGRLRLVSGDIAKPDTRRKLVAQVDELGRIDLLVNNASELGRSPLPTLAEYPVGEIDRVFRVNVHAPLSLIQGLLPALRESHGRIVNISSDAARGGYPGWGVYGASKAALDLLSLTFAHELDGSGVSVISVDPGDMRTAMHQAAYLGQDISDRPLPEATLPFWAWLLHQDASKVNGVRFQAQSDRWEVSP